MPARKHNPGEALAAYTAAIHAEPGITTVALASRFGVARDSITLVLTKSLSRGDLERTRATAGNPVRWYPRGMRPNAETVTLNQVLAVLRAAGKDGAVIGDVAFAISRGSTCTESRLRALQRDGRVTSRREHPGTFGTGTRPARWFLAEFAPEERAAEPRPLQAAPKSKAVTLPAGADPIIPPTVKVTVCPAGVDHRFTFTPPPGWVGQITRDWREPRLGSQR